MKLARTVLIVAPLIFAFLSCQDHVRDFTPKSEFIFEGTILLLNSSTIDVQDVGDLAVVKVERIISGGETFSHLAGENITVRLKNPQTTKLNDRKVFFSRSWIFGESVAVIEIGNIAAPSADEIQKIADKVTRIQEDVEKDKLLARIAQTELIVGGTVVNVRRHEYQAGVSEHDPQWREAVIRVKNVYRGQYRDSLITVIYPGSDDVMWFKSPKYNVDMEGLWLLKPYEWAGRKLEFLTAIEKADFYMKAEEAKILKLITK